MKPGETISPRQQGLFDSHAFIGEITASVTHELNNVLGTIEQVSGLAEDLAATDLPQQTGIAARLNDIAERIARQSERGTILIKRLNRLAHLSDEPVTEFDLAELLENILAMCERFANMRKVSLRVTGLEQKVMLRTSPLLIAQAIYNVFRSVLAGVVPGEPLEICLEATDEGGEILFDGYRGDNALNETPQMERAGAVVAGLGGHLEISSDGDRSKVRLQLLAGI